ncbi:MAG: hypothetical protein N3A53_06455, partial [Verrucomicrobiae bacterium]|nr:hypothetical protein [Verrucomicrobiae bacterium]
QQLAGGGVYNYGALHVAGSTLTFYGPVHNDGFMVATNGVGKFLGGLSGSGVVLTAPEPSTSYSYLLLHCSQALGLSKSALARAVSFVEWASCTCRGAKRLIAHVTVALTVVQADADYSRSLVTTMAAD